tara:strand:+ start:1217 stop:2617 length:1401 start_codon:yes stop_codon:yes gene_type:complete
MAINFLNTVDLNKNQLNNAAIQNLATDPATGVLGQVYYNTTDSMLKICITASTATPTAAVWASVSGDVESVSASTADNRKGIAVVDSGGPNPVVGLDIIGQTNLGATPAADDELLIYDLSETENKAITVANLVGGFETTYTLPVTAGTIAPAAPTTGIITLTGSDGSTDAVNFIGTTGRVNVSGAPGTSAITIDLTEDVTIVDDLTVGGVIAQSQSGETNSLASPLNMNSNKVTNIATGTASTDGVNLGQVELLVAGVGVFQGGYNATTDPGVPVISGTANIALDQGDYFVVSHDGDITFSDQVVSVEVGDFIFANAAITAADDPASTEYTFVQSDANIAGAGATDGATEKGVAGFDSVNFDVSASGWVQLISQKNPYGRKQALNNTTPSSRVESGGVTTFTLDLANSTLFGTGAVSEDIAVEVTEIASPFQTVYAEITRSGSASMAIAFTGSIANDTYRVLLTHV